MGRQSFRGQSSFFQTPIDEIQIDFFSRDQMPKLLRGLQEVYKDKSVFNKVTHLIREDLKEKQTNFDPNNSVGVSGATAWEVFVLLCLRQNGKYDYDQIADLASNHNTLRAIMGIPSDLTYNFGKSTVHENIKGIKAKTLVELNDEVIKIGQSLLNPNDESLELVADTFVFETNIHSHADYASIKDGVKALLRIGKHFSKALKLSGYRKSKHINKQVKYYTQKLGKLNRSRKANKESLVKDCLKELVSYMNLVFEKSFHLLEASLGSEDKSILGYRNELQYYMTGTSHEADLAVRRLFEGEKIPSKEKIFSLFEAHTELICKGKAKAPREYGHRVLVIQDQFGVIHACERVDSGYVDSEIIVDAIKKLKEKYPNLKSLSLDKGFWSPENKDNLEQLVDLLILPKKGKGKPFEEQTAEYRRLRFKHSKVESCINALESGNNLHICYDKGLKGFDQAVARAGLVRNLHEIGSFKIAEDRESYLSRKSA